MSIQPRFAECAPSKRRQGDLLNCLADELGCIYLSDLRLGDHRDSLRAMVEDIPADAFQPRQWQDAVYYLGGPCLPADAPAQKARDRLLQALAP